MRIAVFPMHGLDKQLDEGVRTRDGHLMAALARREDVDELVVIDRPATLPELALRRRRRRASLARGVASAHLGGGKFRPVFGVSTAVVAPLRERRLWWAHAYSPTHLTLSSLRAIDCAVRTCDAVLAFAPSSVELWNGASAPVILDLLDDWSLHPQLGAAQPARFESVYRAAVGRATTVTANAEGTVALARRFDRDALLLPNAVDASRIARIALETLDRWLDRLCDMPRPWLVYAGKLQQRLDVELMVELAETTRGTLIVAGPVLDQRWVAPLRSARRTQLLGDVAYDSLPGLLACADVAVIPHRVGAGEVGGDPLKVYEYSAAGARIVSTPIGGWRRFAPLCEAIVPRERFADAVTSLGLDPRSPRARLLGREDRPAPPSWDARAGVLRALLSRSHTLSEEAAA